MICLNKGQLTIFVIIGLVILLLVGIGLMVLKPESVQINQRLDTAEVQQYVESCLNQVAKEGLILAGAQGGYIYPSMSYNEEQPWLAASLKTGPQQVPYWYYVSDCDNGYGCPDSEQIALCSLDSSCPIDSRSDTSIQNELETYIKNELNNCLDYNTITKFDVKQLKAPQTQVLFTQDDVNIKLLLPLEISNDKGTSSMDRFSTTLNIDFEEIYTLANDIVWTQQNTTFVENNLMNLIAIYGGLDSNKLPPTNEAEFLGNSAIYWTRSRVQEQLEKEVLPYMNFLQITNAYYGYYPIVNVAVDDQDYMDFAEGVFMYSEITLGHDQSIPGQNTQTPSYPNLGVSFLYPYAPIYLNINDKEVLTGQQMSSGNIFEKLLGFLLTRYKFKYDVAFPLLTTIEDPNAFGGEGYTFTFAIEGNILNNKPLRLDNLPIDVRTGSSSVNINDPQNHVQKDITINVYDKYTNSVIDDAIIYYDCGNKFMVGTTKQGTWSGTMPYCAVGGSIIVEKPLEYMREGISYNNFNTDPVDPFIFELWPIKQKEITVYKLSPEAISNITAGGNIEDYRESLVFGETLSYDLELDANGSTVTNDFSAGAMTPEEESNYTRNVTVTHMQVPLNQFALLTLQKQKDSIYDETMPLLNTHTFGKDNEQLETSSNQQRAALLQLYQNGTINQSTYDDLLGYLNQEQERTIKLSGIKTVDLVPGTYDIDLNLFYDGDLKIPEERRRIKTGLFSKKTIILPAQSFNSWLQGGLKTQITLTPEQLYNDDLLVLYVLEQPLPKTWKELENYETIEDYQHSINPNIYAPTFE